MTPNKRVLLCLLVLTGVIVVCSAAPENTTVEFNSGPNPLLDHLDQQLKQHITTAANQIKTLQTSISSVQPNKVNEVVRQKNEQQRRRNEFSRVTSEFKRQEHETKRAQWSNHTNKLSKLEALHSKLDSLDRQVSRRDRRALKAEARVKHAEDRHSIRTEVQEKHDNILKMTSHQQWRVVKTSKQLKEAQNKEHEAWIKRSNAQFAEKKRELKRRLKQKKSQLKKQARKEATSKESIHKKQVKVDSEKRKRRAAIRAKRRRQRRQLRQLRVAKRDVQRQRLEWKLNTEASRKQKETARKQDAIFKEVKAKNQIQDTAERNFKTRSAKENSDKQRHRDAFAKRLNKEVARKSKIAARQKRILKKARGRARDLGKRIRNSKAKGDELDALKDAYTTIAVKLRRLTSRESDNKEGAKEAGMKAKEKLLRYDAKNVAAKIAFEHRQKKQLAAKHAESSQKQAQKNQSLRKYEEMHKEVDVKNSREATDKHNLSQELKQKRAKRKRAEAKTKSASAVGVEKKTKEADRKRHSERLRKEKKKLTNIQKQALREKLTKDAAARKHRRILQKQLRKMRAEQSAKAQEARNKANRRRKIERKGKERKQKQLAKRRRLAERRLKFKRRREKAIKRAKQQLARRNKERAAKKAQTQRLRAFYRKLESSTKRDFNTKSAAERKRKGWLMRRGERRCKFLTGVQRLKALRAARSERLKKWKRRYADEDQFKASQQQLRATWTRKIRREITFKTATIQRQERKDKKRRRVMQQRRQELHDNIRRRENAKKASAIVNQNRRHRRAMMRANAGFVRTRMAEAENKKQVRARSAKRARLLKGTALARFQLQQLKEETQKREKARRLVQSHQQQLRALKKAHRRKRQLLRNKIHENSAKHSFRRRALVERAGKEKFKARIQTEGQQKNRLRRSQNRNRNRLRAERKFKNDRRANQEAQRKKLTRASWEMRCKATPRPRKLPCLKWRHHEVRIKTDRLNEWRKQRRQRELLARKRAHIRRWAEDQRKRLIGQRLSQLYQYYVRRFQLQTQRWRQKLKSRRDARRAQIFMSESWSKRRRQLRANERNGKYLKSQNERGSKTQLARWRLQFSLDADAESKTKAAARNNLRTRYLTQRADLRNKMVAERTEKMGRVKALEAQAAKLSGVALIHFQAQLRSEDQTKQANRVTFERNSKAQAKALNLRYRYIKNYENARKQLQRFRVSEQFAKKSQQRELRLDRLRKKVNNKVRRQSRALRKHSRALANKVRRDKARLRSKENADKADWQRKSQQERDDKARRRQQIKSKFRHVAQRSLSQLQAWFTESILASKQLFKVRQARENNQKAWTQSFLLKQARSAQGDARAAALAKLHQEGDQKAVRRRLMIQNFKRNLAARRQNWQQSMQREQERKRRIRQLYQQKRRDMDQRARNRRLAYWFRTARREARQRLRNLKLRYRARRRRVNRQVQQEQRVKAGKMRRRHRRLHVKLVLVKNRLAARVAAENLKKRYNQVVQESHIKTLTGKVREHSFKALINGKVDQLKDARQLNLKVRKTLFVRTQNSKTALTMLKKLLATQRVQFVKKSQQRLAAFKREYQNAVAAVKRTLRQIRAKYEASKK